MQPEWIQCIGSSPDATPRTGVIFQAVPESIETVSPQRMQVPMAGEGTSGGPTRQQRDRRSRAVASAPDVEFSGGFLPDEHSVKAPRVADVARRHGALRTGLRRGRSRP